MTLDQFIVQNFNEPVSLRDLDSFAHEQVFLNVSNVPVLPASGHQPATPGDTVSVPVSATPRGSMVVLYTDAADARLNKPFAGVALEEAVQIVYAMRSVSGLLLQSSQAAALAIEKMPGDEVKSR